MFGIYKHIPHLQCGMSEKKDGSMNSPVTIDDAGGRAHVAHNRKVFLRGAGIPYEKSTVPFLVHGSEVAVIDERNMREPHRKDGYITAVPNIFLTITVADCFPLFFYDPVKKSIGLSHAGWRGTMKDIVEHTVETLAWAYHSKPRDILLGIGPGIQKCHFEIKENTIGQFAAFPAYITKKDAGIYAVDLQGIIREKAYDKGIRTIEASGECTFCKNEKYFSYRRDKPRIPEVMLAYIGSRSAASA